MLLLSKWDLLLCLSLACDTILNITQEVFLYYPHRFQLFHSPQHSWGIRIFIQITQSVEQIVLLDSHVKQVESEMTEIMLGLDSVIMTIPGIGYINGGMILGEIGDIHRFAAPKQLLAFAGLDPTVYQSGNFNASHTRMSKRGSTALRYALINAAHNVVKNNATFKSYYDTKIAEGRTHYNALGHCAGKLVRVIHKMLSDDVAFNLG